MTNAAPEMFKARRAAVAKACPGWLLLLPAGSPAARNATVQNPFHHEADYFYLTGLDEPGGFLLMQPGGSSVLYLPEPDPLLTRWEGPRLSLEQAAAESAVDEARPVAQLWGDLAKYLQGSDALGWRFGGDIALDLRVIEALGQASQARATGRIRKSVHDPRGPLGLLRQIKEDWEIERLRAAAEVTGQAHLELMRSAREGESEQVVAGRFEVSCRNGGATRMAYNTIVAHGARACCLHHTPGSERLRAGELVLVDAGCELDGYACDLTRTWPVGGHFSEAQAALYDAVLEAQQVAIKAVRPGATLEEIHQAALGVLGAACDRLGLGRDPARWFPHQTSHWIGLDVHDSGPYTAHGVPVKLAPGMTLTIEPGLYIDEDASDAPETLRGLGIRIEDTVLVTDDGVEVLTSFVPRGREKIETWMRGG